MPKNNSNLATRSDIDEVLTTLRSFVASSDKDFQNIRGSFRNVDQKFDKIDKRFKKIDTQFDQIDEQFLRIDFNFHRVYDDLDELKAGQSGARKSRSAVLGSLDSIMKRLEVTEDERIVMGHILGRHNLWLKQLARKIGITLNEA